MAPLKGPPFISQIIVIQFANAINALRLFEALFVVQTFAECMNSSETMTVDEG